MTAAIEKFDPTNPEHRDPTKFEVIKKGDVFEHTLAALKVCASKDPLVVLGVLFHDIGKPIVKHYATMDDGEVRVRYTGHDQGKFFDSVAERLKFSTEEADFIRFCIEKHMVSFDLHCMKKSRALEIIEHPLFWPMMEVSFADSFCVMADGLVTSPRVSKSFALNWEHACSVLENKEPERHVKLKKLINGRMIMDHLGIKGGPILGKIKTAAIDMAIEHDLDPDDPQTLETVKEFISAGNFLS